MALPSNNERIKISNENIQTLFSGFIYKVDATINNSGSTSKSEKTPPADIVSTRKSS
jgi:hypothetical protein